MSSSRNTASGPRPAVERVVELAPDGLAADFTYAGGFEFLQRIATERAYGLADDEIEDGILYEHRRWMTGCKILGDTIFLEFTD